MIVFQGKVQFKWLQTLGGVLGALVFLGLSIAMLATGEVIVGLLALVPILPAGLLLWGGIRKMRYSGKDVLRLHDDHVEYLSFDSGVKGQWGSARYEELRHVCITQNGAGFMNKKKGKDKAGTLSFQKREEVPCITVMLDDCLEAGRRMLFRLDGMQIDAESELQKEDGGVPYELEQI